MAYRERLLKDISGFEALNNLPYVNPQDIPSEDRECYICKEPFPETDEIRNCSIADDDSLQLCCGQEGCFSGDIPVRLHCGHVAGLQCLTQWVLFRNFDSYCPMCNTRIIPQTQPATSFMSLEMVETIRVLEQGDYSERREFLTTILTDVAIGNSTEDKMIRRTLMIAREFLEAFGKDISRKRWTVDGFDTLRLRVEERLHDRKLLGRYIGKCHDQMNGFKYQNKEGYQLRLLNGLSRDVSASIMGCCGFTDLNKSTAFLAGRMEEQLQQEPSIMKSIWRQVVCILKAWLKIMYWPAFGLIGAYSLVWMNFLLPASFVGFQRLFDTLGGNLKDLYKVFDDKRL